MTSISPPEGQDKILLELAERCEAATGPDREMDVAIVYGLYPDIGNYAGQCVGDDPIFWHAPYRKQPCPEFTASLDAAMTLVPEGWRISQWREFGHGGFEAELKLRSAIQYEKGEASSLALALCAAALRALNQVRAA